MKREVYLTDKAERQLNECADWYAEQKSRLGEQWFNQIVSAIQAIAEHPERYGHARENKILGHDFREMLFGLGRHKTHRVLYLIRPDRIVVHCVRHVARADLTIDDL